MALRSSARSIPRSCRGAARLAVDYRHRQDENFLTSDANAVVAHTRQVVISERLRCGHGELHNASIRQPRADTAKVQISQLEFDAESAERATSRIFMLKGNL